MESYTCSPQDIPNLLYRIHYPGARVDYLPETGFSARDRERTFSDGELDQFAQAINHHFTWSYRDPLPFISLFSDLEHAQNWGCKTPWSPHGIARYPWTLHTIDTTSIRRTHTFFKLSDIIDIPGITIPEKAQQHIKGAYICLYDIPSSAIGETRTNTEVEQVREARRRSRKWEMLEEIDRHDYLGEYGNDDSDREMMQENWNTIFDKNIEDGW